MPFTPLHMGPGLAVKAIARHHFSLMVFGFSQVAMDLEPLVRMIRGDLVIHGVTHTYLGATVIGLLSVLVGRPVCQFLLTCWKTSPEEPFMAWLRGPERISWLAAITGAFAGTYSHVLLDSIMHSDMQPLAPLAKANDMLHIVSVDSLHLLCLLSAVAGALVLSALYWIRHRTDGNRR